MIEHLVSLLAELAKQANKAIENGKAQAEWARAGKLESLRFVGGGIGGASPRLSGRVDGRSVVIDTYKLQRKGADQQVWTRYKIDVAGELPRGLRIEPVAPLPGLYQPAVATPQMPSGDEAFDRHIKIFTEDPAATSVWLTDDRIVRLRKAFNSYRGVRISESGVRFDRRGLDDKASRIQRTLRDLVELASHLGSQGGPVLIDDDPAQRGSSWEALVTGGLAPANEPRIAHEEPPEPVFAEEPEPVFVEEPEPVLVAEPPVLVEEDVDERPAVDESLPEEAAARAPIAAEPPRPEPATEATEANDDAPSDLTPLEIATELFEPSRPGFETARLFDEEFAHERVRWTGTVERVESFSSDLVFGAGPGLKVRLELCELPGDGYGRDVHASVALPIALEAALRARRGQPLTVRGRLVKCDPFLRTLFLAEGAADGLDG